MKARFPDEQIISMIKEQESGEKTADVCRRRGISSATFYKYKSKYGGMEPSDAKRLRALEDENGMLNKLLAEQMFPSRAIAAQYPAGQGAMRCCETSIQKSGDDTALSAIGPRTMDAWAKRQAVVHLCEAHGVSQRRACDVLQIDRSTVRYLSRRGDDAEL